MKFSPKVRLAACVVATALAGQGHAAVAWDESVSGDLSGDGLVPTAIGLAAGSNLILGSTGRLVAGGTVDRDYFSIVVPAGQQLAALTLLGNTTFLGPLGQGFIALQIGPQLTFPPAKVDNAEGLLGWWHYAVDDIDQDLLAKMATPNRGSTGFSPPLGAGQYALWVQDTGVGTASYGFDLVLTPVPEPGAAGLLAAGLAVLALRRRRQH